MNWLDRLNEVRGKVKELGYEKERAALALLSLSFFAFIYFFVSFNTPPEWGRVFLALSSLYLVGFLAVASQWFWARWFASGLGWSGFMVGMMALVMVGWHPSLAIYTVLHGLVIAMLLGAKMAARYEMQTSWRERYKMDEFGVARLGKAVTRGSASLPTLVMWALAPREGGDQTLWLPLMATGLCVLGLSAVLRMRSWGLLVLAGAAFTGVAYLLAPGVEAMPGLASMGGTWTVLTSPFLALGFLTTTVASPFLALAFLTAALVPFAGPLVSFLSSRRG